MKIILGIVCIAASSAGLVGGVICAARFGRDVREARLKAETLMMDVTYRWDDEVRVEYRDLRDMYRLLLGTMEKLGRDAARTGFFVALYLAGLVASRIAFR